jgi:hypothetical protein
LRCQAGLVPLNRLGLLAPVKAMRWQRLPVHQDRSRRCPGGADVPARRRLAALRWISLGYGYEITGADVLDAYAAILQAAPGAGVSKQQVNEQIRAMIRWDRGTVSSTNDTVSLSMPCFPEFKQEQSRTKTRCGEISKLSPYLPQRASSRS